MAFPPNKITKRPLYNKMDNLLYPGTFLPKFFREALDYKPRPDDVIIVTYPKCGTTWMQNVALYTFRKGRELEDISQFRKYSPFIDMLGKEKVDMMIRPGPIKTHIPLTHFTYSTDAKYIFVTRNPKDCAVSLHHHTTRSDSYGYRDTTFDEFFELFMAGETEYNDYFDHLLSWYPFRNDSNVFHITYEAMTKDIRSVITRLAKFLGEEFAVAIEKDNAVLNNILLYSSFEFMKKNLDSIYNRNARTNEAGEIVTDCKDGEYITEFRDTACKNQKSKNFFRKGIVNDWKNVLTAEQSDRIDTKFAAKFKGTEIINWFS